MKHCFIINPAAGSGKDQKVVLPRILDAAKRWGADYEIHRTSGPGEAAIFTRKRIEEIAGEPVRFYVCGGDGTVSEVLNGLYGAEQAELAIIPVGSGNDYIRNFGSKPAFLDITAQFAGKAIPVDVMRYSSMDSLNGENPEAREAGAGKVQTGGVSYALNMINMGFDARVVRHMERIKNKFFIRGTGAYVSGVAIELAAYKKSRAVFRPVGGEPFETDILLAGVGSGRFSGGGFDGIPCAVVNDGMLDLMVIDPITRMEFIQLVGVYHDGRHLENRRLKEHLHMFRVSEVEITPVGGLVFTADGEVHYTERPFKVSVASQKLRFVLPDGVDTPNPSI